MSLTLGKMKMSCRSELDTFAQTAMMVHICAQERETVCSTNLPSCVVLPEHFNTSVCYKLQLLQLIRQKTIRVTPSCLVVKHEIRLGLLFFACTKQK